MEHYFDEKNGKMPVKYQYKKYWGVINIQYCIHGHFNGKRGFGVDDYYPELNKHSPS